MSEWVYKKIPQTCFFYWGNQRMPFLNFLSVVSFRDHNPDWKIIVIRPADDKNIKGRWSSGEQEGEITDSPNIDYSKYLERYADEVQYFNFEELLGDNTNINDVHRADALRPYLMHRHGGVWFDFDIFFLKPLSAVELPSRFWFSEARGCTKIPTSADSPLVGPIRKDRVRAEDIDTVIYCYTICDPESEEIGKAVFPTGVFYSSAGNPFFKKISEVAVERCKFPNEYQVAGPEAISSLWKTLYEVYKEFPNLNLCNLRSIDFYPINWASASLLFKTSRFNLRARSSIYHKGAAGVHWFNGSLVSRKYAGVSNETWGSNTVYSQLISKYKNAFKGYEK